MKLAAFVLSLNIFAEIHSYTPTFRNEATHPLKAPTESTLGLQVNDDTAARTKSNEPAKQEPVFSGGNHFEYMLLNDSNILLTSLQNDGPFDTAAAQFASSKQKQPRKNERTSLNITTDPTKSVQIEATLPPHNLTAQNESNATFRIISKTNFKVELPVISSRPAISGGGKSVVELIDADPQLMDPQKGSFDQRSLKTTKFLVNPLTKTEPDDYDDAFTKLLISNGILKPVKSVPYHPAMQEYVRNPVSVDGALSYNNDSPHSGASVESPIKGTRNSENLFHDNDGTDSGDTSQEMQARVNNSDSKVQNFSAHPGTTILTAGASRNQTKILNMKRTNYVVRQNVDESAATSTNTEGNANSFAGSTTFEYDHNHTERNNLAARPLENQTEILDQHSFRDSLSQNTNSTSIEISHKSAEPWDRSNASENLGSIPKTSSLTNVVDRKVSIKEPIPFERVPKMSVGIVPLRQSSSRSKFYRPADIHPAPDKSSAFQITGATSNALSSDAINDFDERTDLTASALKNQAKINDRDSSRNSVSESADPAPEAASLRKPPARSMLREFEDAGTSRHKFSDKNDEGADRQLTIPKFENLLKSMVQKLFNSVTDYVGKLNKPNSSHEATTIAANSLMHIKRFVLFNITMVERGWLHRFPSLTPPAQPTAILSCTFPWTNLLDNRTVNVQRHVNDLFDDDSADFFWFGVPLQRTAPYPLLTKETFCDLFETDLAVRMYLEYQGRKIEAVFALPRTLSPNISMSAANLSVDVNAHTRVDTNRSEVVELLESNVTVFRYDSKPYPILELGTSKLIPPKAMAKVWVTKHEDIETFINFILGSLCLFCILSFTLYGVYRLIQIHPPVQSFRNFRDRYRFLERPKSDRRRRRRSEALNVIFSESFDNKRVNSSWLEENSQHTSCMLKPCKEVPDKPAVLFPSRERAESNEPSRVDTVAVDSPRLNKENKVPMMGYRSYCILLPHTRPYDDDERCFENPNYRQDAR